MSHPVFRSPFLPALARCTALSALALGCAASHAEEAWGQGPLTVYGSVTPLGLGLGWGHRLSEHWQTRAYVNSGTLGHAHSHVDLSDIRYETTFKAKPGVSAFADYFPWTDSGWRLSAGLIASSMRTDITGEPNAQGQYRINGHDYSAAQVGKLSGRLKFGPLGAYAGGGWESAPLGDKGWRFVSDAGLFYVGRASSTLEASGAAGNAALQADLAAERRALRKQGVGLAIGLGAAYAF